MCFSEKEKYSQRTVIKGTYGTRDYVYYTEAEAKERGIEYISDWTRAETDDWLLTDDGYVALCIRALTATSCGKQARVVKITTGVFRDVDRKKRPLVTDLQENPDSFINKKADHKDPKRRLSATERKFVELFVSGLNIIDSFTGATRTRPWTTTRFKYRAHLFAARANVRMAIGKEMQEKVTNSGLTVEWWADLVKREAEDSEKGSDRIKALEMVGKLLGLDRPEQEQTTSFLGISVKELDKIRGERSEMLGDGEPGRNVGEGSIGGAEASAGDERGHGAVREAPVPESVIEADTTVSQ